MKLESHECCSAKRTTCAGILCVSLWVLVALTSVGGCSRSRYLTVRKVPKNPLAGPLKLLSRMGPHPTDRTLQTLRRYDLEELHEQDPSATLSLLQEEIAQEPTADKIHAFSELAYISAYKADVLRDNKKALNLYGAAAFHAYDYLFDARYDDIRNPYDPRFRRACDVYNASLEAAMRLIRGNGQLLPGNTLMIDTGSERIQVDVVARGAWSDQRIERLEFVSDYEITGLKNHHHSHGLGVPVLGVREAGNPNDPVEQYYPSTLSFPLTAFLRIGREHEGRHEGQHPYPTRRWVLELFDPLDSNHTVVADRLVPLETDISTALGYELEQGAQSNQSLIATIGLLNPAQAKDVKGLYMVEPYDPDKIPVLMVHGLWSSPMTWMEMFNDLLAYPEIRSNYQFWFYLYPTGEPFWYAARQLRDDLREVRQVLDPHHANPTFEQMVLVGHSMGGLVSIMQTLESGNHFWNVLSEKPFSEWNVDPEVRDRVADTVFFRPNPMIRRVITLGTPHRGSEFANEYTRFLAHKLIRLPANVLWMTQQLAIQNPGFFRDTELLTISTSIDSLAPDSPIFPAMSQARQAPWTKYHNIVGVVENDWLLSSFSEHGDGVVSYESARRDDFCSELVVNADHISVHAHPRSVLEVRRVLRQHLNEIRSPPPPASAPLARRPAPGLKSPATARR
ncbi:MAG: esterase/lipase family protein [Planctomycetota bacterium]